ncbi:hypothetical protein J5N97_011331 [Dioscorea zingiberensis]|uniref:GDSL esterase/lipase n=1 Tax=Dioscorea zingiberensis TaxID=325984 RepID=A0A9D5D0F1_9LILI|nr:hypothetical protein J5N97_011331 [Dioscorea zingiberensis]
MDSLTLYVLLVHVSFSFMLSCPVAVQGSSPDAMFVFGDSQADVGNNNYIKTIAMCNVPHYGIDYPGGKPTGRFSNGKNIVDFLVRGSSPAAMFVFGDSLSDVGNNNYFITIAKCNFPHYGIDYPGGKPTGRFSNGKNFVDLLAEKLRVPSPKPYLSLFKTDNPLEFLEGVNFASGSAGILTSTHQGLCIPLKTQIDFYSLVFKALVEKLGIFQVQRFISSSILYINIGSNDFQVYDGTCVLTYVRLLVCELEGELKRILELGARKLVFIGTEPVGCWPAVRASNKSPGDCNKEINEASSLYNEEVVLLLKKLQSEYSDMRYSFFHSYRVFDKFIKHPENYGFNESKAACCGMGNLNAEFACNPLAKYCSDRTKYVFWDGWHQTEATANLLVSMAFDGLPPNVFPVNVRELSGLNAENAHVIDQ